MVNLLTWIFEVAEIQRLSDEYCEVDQKYEVYDALLAAKIESWNTAMAEMKKVIMFKDLQLFDSGEFAKYCVDQHNAIKNIFGSADFRLNGGISIYRSAINDFLNALA